jgi:hypothetical protein
MRGSTSNDAAHLHKWKWFRPGRRPLMLRGRQENPASTNGASKNCRETLLIILGLWRPREQPLGSPSGGTCAVESRGCHRIVVPSWPHLASSCKMTCDPGKAKYQLVHPIHVPGGCQIWCIRAPGEELVPGTGGRPYLVHPCTGGAEPVHPCAGVGWHACAPGRDPGGVREQGVRNPGGVSTGGVRKPGGIGKQWGVPWPGSVGKPRGVRKPRGSSMLWGVRKPGCVRIGPGASVNHWGSVSSHGGVREPGSIPNCSSILRK